MNQPELKQKATVLLAIEVTGDILQVQKQLEIKEGPSGYNGVTEERASKM